MLYGQLVNSFYSVESADTLVFLSCVVSSVMYRIACCLTFTLCWQVSGGGHPGRDLHPAVQGNSIALLTPGFAYHELHLQPSKTRRPGICSILIG